MTAEWDPQSVAGMAGTFARAEMQIARVHTERTMAAFEAFGAAAGSAMAAFGAAMSTQGAAVDPLRAAFDFGLDAAQRSILFWDTLRQRGNGWIAHEKAGKPPLLAFASEGPSTIRWCGSSHRRA
jgi:hypothetical protein